MTEGTKYFTHLPSQFGLSPFPYSIPIKKIKGTSKLQVAFAHQMVIKSQKKKLWHDQKANHAKRLLNKIPLLRFNIDRG